MQWEERMIMVTTRLPFIGSHACQEIVPGKNGSRVEIWQSIPSFLGSAKQPMHSMIQCNSKLNSIQKINKTKIKLNITFKKINICFHLDS